MRVLLTGFGPFPGAPLNPSGGLAKVLARRRRPAFADIVRTAHVFATTYACVDHDLPELFAQKPDIVLMFGLAGLAGRMRQLRIETRARNAVSVLFPDASGYRPQFRVIAAGAAAALRGGAPFPRLLGAVRNSAVPARLSRNAGNYLCNYAYWRALQHAQGSRTLVTFVHIPPVALNPRRRRQNSSRSPSFSGLIAAAEMLLISLLAASRR